VSGRTLLLFDIDGTLLLSGGAGLRALNRTFEELFGVASGFDGIPVAGRTDALLLRDAAARAEVRLDEAARQRFHDRYCDLLADEIAPPNPRKRLMPGVARLIPALAGRDELTVALLTGNFARAARIKLEHFGLWRHFRGGAFGDDAPDRDGLVPVALSRVMTAAGARVAAADAIVIGDTPLDVQCAQVAGARSIAVETGSFDASALRAQGADEVLPDLADLDRFLEAVRRVARAGPAPRA